MKPILVTESRARAGSGAEGGGRSTHETGAAAGANAAMWWGAAGVVLVFAYAAVRLGGRGIETLRGGLEPWQWLVLAVLTAAFVYGEGHRALQRRYNPWVMQRLEVLRGERRWWYAALAPLHTLSLIGASASILLRAWAGTAAIAMAVAVVSRFPDPWRGITDFAVAAALAWGAVALALRSVRGLTRRRPVEDGASAVRRRASMEPVSGAQHGAERPARAGAHGARELSTHRRV